MIYDVLFSMLCTFFKGLFLNPCTFFKGLFVLFCHFFKGLLVAKIHFFLLKRKEIGNYFLLKGKIFLSLQLFFVLSPLEKVENRIFCLCNLLIIKSRSS